MNSTLAIPLFVMSLAVTLQAARLFARRLDRLGVRFGFPEALIGLLTALAADGPEISSALFALIKGSHDVGVGVLVGANTFNLAAMIGCSALLAGRVRLPRQTLLLEGSVGAAITLLGVALLLGWISPGLALGLAALAAIPYLAVLIGGSELLWRARGSARTLSRLSSALDSHPHATPGPPSLAGESPTHHLLAMIVVDVTLIVAGSAGMVQSALALSGSWGISRAVLGVFVLAPACALPNAITGIRLGRAGRGAALVGEAFNSNSINLAAGVLAPSLFVTLAAGTQTAKLQLAWLAGMTAVCLLSLARRGGMRRWEGATLIGLYGGFVAIQAFGG